ncbi:uncharacterized protein Fot_41568 [Forsythia ovata]|uniref:Uncharacterized protein n=1 Tax=Forsythia ovata TaxID=205694 RepID=A0ABD1RJH1_9LAMI
MEILHVRKMLWVPKLADREGGMQLVNYKRITAQKAAALLEQANSVDEQNISDATVHDHNEEVENVESNEVESDKVDQKAPVTEKEALMESPVKKISINQVHNLENKDTVSGVMVSRKKRSALSLLKSWFLCKTSKVPRSENRSHSKSLIARQNNLQSPPLSTPVIVTMTEKREQKLKEKFNDEEMPQEKTRRKFIKKHRIFCFKA